jgi:hypothetical protein
MAILRVLGYEVRKTGIETTDKAGANTKNAVTKNTVRESTIRENTIANSNSARWSKVLNRYPKHIGQNLDTLKPISETGDVIRALAAQHQSHE